MTEDSLLSFGLPAVSCKKVTADFAGGSISCDGGLVLLRAAERQLGLAEALVGCIREWRGPDRMRSPALAFVWESHRNHSNSTFSVRQQTDGKAAGLALAQPICRHRLWRGSASDGPAEDLAAGPQSGRA